MLVLCCLHDNSGFIQLGKAGGIGSGMRRIEEKSTQEIMQTDFLPGSQMPGISNVLVPYRASINS